MAEAASVADPACRKSFGLTWPPLPASPPAQTPLAPSLPAAFFAEMLTRSETCVAVLATDLERSPAPTDADRRAYAAWSKTFTWTSLWAGRTSAEINNQLGALAEQGARRLAQGHEADTVAACMKDSADAPPVG